MVRYMLDTNICIYITKATPPALLERFNLERSALCVSSITQGELWYGVENSGRPAENGAVLEDFLSRLSVQSFGEDAGRHFGHIKAALRRAGTPVGPYDMLIAAHARSLGLIVVTNNRREFDRIPGLLVENWV